jgi:hypothetical protein
LRKRKKIAGLGFNCDLGPPKILKIAESENSEQSAATPGAGTSRIADVGEPDS